MSILTKVFIVLLAVLSIAFTTMTVAMVAQTTNWKDTAEKYRQHASVADSSLRHQIAAHSVDLATSRDAVQRHRERTGDLEVQLRESTAGLASIRAELARAESERSSTEAMNRGLLAQIEIARGNESSYRQQREMLDRQNIDLQQRNIDLNGRVNELTSTISVLAEQKRQFEQQINILRSENMRMSRGAGRIGASSRMEAATGVAMRNIEALTPVQGSAIRGKILEVQGNLVTVSVGASAGVTEGMVFVIHRGGEYIGDLKISMVDPDKAAGRLVRPCSPLLGDKVSDTLAMSGSGG